MKYFALIFTILAGSFNGFGQKKVLMEKMTNAYCGSCPNASIMIQNMVDETENIIWINHHKPVTWTTNDLVNEDSKAFWEEVNVFATPLGLVDRMPINSSLLLYANQWESQVFSTLQKEQEVTIKANNLNYKKEDRTLSFTIDTKFLTLPAGNEYRLSAMIVEDSVYGTEQHNYFNDVDGHPLEGLGDIIWNYPHRYVVRAMLDNIWGTEGSIPLEITANETYSNQYSYQIPQEFNDRRISIVCVLSNYDKDDQLKRSVIQSERFTLSEYEISLSDTQEIALDLEVTIFPNPTSTELNISSEAFIDRFKIIDTNGNLILSGIVNGTNKKVNISHLHKGAYQLLLINQQNIQGHLFSVQ